MQRSMALVIAGTLLLGGCGGNSDDGQTAALVADQGSADNAQPVDGVGVDDSDDAGACVFVLTGQDCPDGLMGQLSHIPVPASAVQFSPLSEPEFTDYFGQAVLVDAPTARVVEFYMEELATGGFEITSENATDPESDTSFGAVIEFIDPEGAAGTVRIRQGDASHGVTDPTLVDVTLTAEG